MAETKNLLLFRKWDLSNVEVVDPGLKTAISLRKQVLPYTYLENGIYLMLKL